MSLPALKEVAASAESPDLATASCHASAGTTLNYFLDRGLNKVCHCAMHVDLTAVTAYKQSLHVTIC